MPVPQRAFYTIWIIPPPSLWPRIRHFSDNLRCLSNQITVPAVPHVDITGVVVDASNDKEVVEKWKAELKTAVSGLTPFKLELGKPIKLQGHDKFSDNVSFPVPIIDTNYQALTDLIIEITQRHFPGTSKRALSPFTDHMCIAEAIPDFLKSGVIKEVSKFSSTLSFDVDRIWLARVDEGRISRDPYYFASKVNYEDLSSIVPERVQAQWLLATMFVHQKPFDSRLRLQKVMFYEFLPMPKSYFNFQRDRYGPYSHYLFDLCEEMKTAGLMYETDSYELGLTPRGEKVAASCFGRQEPELRLQLVRWMRENGGKTTSELLKRVHYEYPEYHDIDRDKPDD